MSVAAAPGNRIASLDQFRGYTVAGMFLVNFIGGFAVVNVLKHHNTYCSYADTIMPQFLFAVGFAFRLTFGRRAELDGVAAAYAWCGGCWDWFSWHSSSTTLVPERKTGKSCRKSVFGAQSKSR